MGRPGAEPVGDQVVAVPHERAEFAWLTDFVGWLPMPDGGEREAALTADYNAEMIEQVARFPGLRSRSIVSSSGFSCRK